MIGWIFVSISDNKVANNLKWYGQPIKVQVIFFWTYRLQVVWCTQNAHSPKITMVEWQLFWLQVQSCHNESLRPIWRPMGPVLTLIQCVSCLAKWYLVFFYSIRIFTPSQPNILLTIRTVIFSSNYKRSNLISCFYWSVK